MSVSYVMAQQSTTQTEPAHAGSTSSETVTTNHSSADSSGVLSNQASQPGKDASRTLHLAPGWEQRMLSMGVYPSSLFEYFTLPGHSEGEKRQLEAQRHYFQAQYFLQMDEPAHALGELRAALEADPGNTQIMLGAVEAHVEARDFDGAQKILTEVLKANPDSVEALVLMAQIRMSEGQDASGSKRRELVNSAAELLEKAKRLQPQNIDILKGLASAYLAQQDVNKVIQAYRDIIAVKPNDTMALLVLGNVLAKTGHQEEAVDFFKRVIEQRRGFINGYLYLGQLYEDMGRDNDGIETYKQALLIEPRNEQLKQRFDAILTKVSKGQGRPAVLRLYEKFAQEYPFSSEVQRLFADQLAAAKQHDRAAAQYRRVLELDPENVEALIALGQVYLDQKNFDEATKYFTKAIDINPEKVDVYEAIASSHLNQKNSAKAIEVYERAIQLNPKADKLYTKLAALYQQEGSTSQALQVLEKGVSHVGEKPELLTLMGDVYDKNKDDQKALGYYRKAYEQTPENQTLFVRVLSSLIRLQKSNEIEPLVQGALERASDRKTEIYALAGETYRSEAQLDKATYWYEKALQESPEKPGIYARLVDLYNAQKLQNKSLSVLQGAPQSVRNSEDIQQLLAYTYSQLKNYDQAIAIYRKMISSNPNDLDGYRMLADAFNEAGRYSEASSTVKQAEEKLGKTEDVSALRAIVLYQQKHYDTAERLFSELAQRKSKSQDTYFYYLGSTYLEQKRYDAAERAFRKAIEANPMNENALNALGYMLADQGMRLEEAKGLIDRALELKPDAPHILDSLGWVYFRMGRYSEARQNIEKAARLMGEDPEVLDHLGDICKAQGNMGQALSYWKRSLALDKNRASVREKILLNEKR